MCDLLRERYSLVWNNSFKGEPWLIHIRDITHKCLASCEEESAHVSLSNDLLICMPWLNPTWTMTHSYVWHDSYMPCFMRRRAYPCMYVPWLIDICAMTHSHLWHDSYMPCFMRRGICWCKEESFHAYCAMTHSYVRHDSFVRAPWLIRMCDLTLICLTSCEEESVHAYCAMTHSYMCHVCHVFICVTYNHTRVPFIHTCEIHLYVTHINESWPTYEHIYIFPCASRHSVLIPSSGHGRLFFTQWVKGVFWVFLFSRHVLPFSPK